MKARRLPKSHTLIRASAPDGRQRISFSFRHVDQAHAKFSYSRRDSTYFCKVIERLSALSHYSAQEFHADRSSAMRAHPIDWEGTSEPDGFAHLNEQLRSSTPFQFAVSANLHGRIHGFFVEHVFFVVWLDPDHSLYPGKK
jgi:capsid protein